MIATAIGRAVRAEEKCEALFESLSEAQEQIVSQDHRIRFLEEHLAQLTRPRELMTIQETAAMLGVCARTLKRWRDEPRPRIPFILMEGGDIRYRIEAIENYLKSRERGALRKAA
jgi:hypothetical protein